MTLIRNTALVCGGREYYNLKKVYEILNNSLAYFKFTRIVNGGATGADTLSSSWADENGIEKQEYKAEWSKYGKAAGPKRNTFMLTEEEKRIICGIVFPGDNGTADMATKMLAAGIRVLDFRKVLPYVRYRD